MENKALEIEAIKKEIEKDKKKQAEIFDLLGKVLTGNVEQQQAQEAKINELSKKIKKLEAVLKENKPQEADKNGK